MSIAHTSAAVAAPAVEAGRRSPLLRRLAGGALAATTLTTLALLLWPASEADKARADGEQLGQAVAQLQAADSAAEADAALAEVHAAAAAAGDHAGDAVAAQVADQEDALARAVDGFAGSRTSSDSFEADLYQVELEIAVDDLASNAEDFRTEGPEVRQAFWEGYDAGLAGE